jgi:hypothetical protein
MVEERMAAGSKLLLSYNIIAKSQQAYLHFMMNDFIPALASIGLKNVGVWHTAYGNYPIRLLIFASENSAVMDRALNSDIWADMEGKLEEFVTDYTRRVVPFDSRFQF